MKNTPLPAVNLEQLLSHAQLPALPQSAISILEISQNPRNGPVEFAVSIEADPGLASQVLRFVNSSYFGFSREISSVRLAVTLVGIRTIKNFALWSAVFSLMPNPKCGSLDLKILWQDSLRRALFARATAKRLGYKQCEDVFAAALLQDMAIPLLAKEIPKVYEELLHARAQGCRLSEIEQKVLEWTHAEAGGIIARQWNLPEEFASFVENHTEIERWSADAEKNAGKMIVAISALLPSAADSRWNEFEQFESLYGNAVGSGGAKLAAMLEEIDAEFAEFAPLLKIASPTKTLLDYYQQLTAASV